MLHSAAFRMTELYRELVPGFPSGYEAYCETQVAGKVLICPPSARKTRMIQSLRHKRTAVLTGWALDPGAIYRYQVDAAFALSDHADYPDLLRYVELVSPRRVYTVHGFATAFAQDLRARGIEAWALGKANQLELAFPSR
jgi:Cft2 family RNA processing exonuclease